MTKEQIKQNAEEYANENDICVCDEEYWSHDDLVKAHINGAESRQAEIDKACELIEKLKYYIPNLHEWDADYEDDERLRYEVEEFLKEQNK